MSARLEEIESRKMEIRSVLDSEAEVNLEEIEIELRTLDEEKKTIESRAKIAQGIQAGIVNAKTIEKPREERKMDVSVMSPEEVLNSTEYRSAFYKKLQGKELSEVEKRSLTTGAGSAADAVPTTTLDLVYDKLRQSVALFPYISVSYVKGNMSLVVANAKNNSSWHVEGNLISGTDDTVSKVSLTGYELVKLVQISKAALAMSISAFESYIVDEIARRMAIAIETAIISGAGTTEPTGIANGVTFNSSNSVQYTTLSFDNIMDGFKLLPTLYHNNALFTMNRNTLFGGLRKIKSSDGLPIFTYNAQDKAAMSILGYPIVLNDQVPDDVIYFGDFKYYHMNFSEGVSIEKSTDSSFKNALIDYRGTLVADAKPTLNEAFVKLYK